MDNLILDPVPKRKAYEMKFIVNALWQHESSIDEEAYRDYMVVLKSTLDSADYVEETIWYKIDEKTHGSVAIYQSEEA